MAGADAVPHIVAVVLNKHTQHSSAHAYLTYIYAMSSSTSKRRAEDSPVKSKSKK